VDFPDYICDSVCRCNATKNWIYTESYKCYAQSRYDDTRIKIVYDGIGFWYGVLPVVVHRVIWRWTACPWRVVTNSPGFFSRVLGFGCFSHILLCQAGGCGDCITFVGEAHEDDAACCPPQARNRGDRQFDDLAFH